MKKIISLFTLTLLISNLTIAQVDSTYISNFQTDLINNYTAIANVSKENYFMILSKAAEYTFSDENPNYRKAIFEIARTQKLSEESALEKLFEHSFSLLRKNSLWNAAAEISALDRQILDVYNESLCPCISSKASNTSNMEAVLAAQQACLPIMLADTVFHRKLKAAAGTSTMNDLFRLQRYLFLLMYEKCGVINYKTNGTILDNSVISHYHNEISRKRRSESMNALILFEKNQLDSLKMIFPDYQKYIPILKEAVKKKNLEQNRVDTYYHGHMMNNSNPRAVLDIHDKDLAGISLTFTYSEHALNSTIRSAKIKRYEASNDERIDEIKVISTQEVKKN